MRERAKAFSLFSKFNPDVNVSLEINTQLNIRAYY
jgi:hypothetical protein